MTKNIQHLLKCLEQTETANVEGDSENQYWNVIRSYHHSFDTKNRIGHCK